MKLYVNIAGLTLPSYGLAITVGVILANCIAFFWVLRKYGLDMDDVLLLEAYCFLGAFLGAKLLYLLVSFPQIEWSRIKEPQYFNQIMQGGFVFYGGLAGALLCVMAAAKLHHIDWLLYVRRCFFLIPLVHCFGRIGCFLAGCCYGIPYDGLFAVTYPEGSFAPANIPLFPVQLVEAAFLVIISLILWEISERKSGGDVIEAYLFLYGCLRFCLEFVRFDSERGSIGILSTSQWISLIMVMVIVARRFLWVFSTKQKI